MAYCSNCGTQIAERIKFCPRCGEKILQQPISQRVSPPPPEPTYEQSNYYRQSGRYQSYHPPSPSKSKTPILIVAVIIVVAIILIAVFAIIYNPSGTNDNEGTNSNNNGNGKSKKDSDNDGVYDDEDIDDDNDGVPDTEDFAQYRNAKIKVTIEGCEVLDQVDQFDYSGEIYFNVRVGSESYRIPEDGEIYPITVGDYKNIGESFTVDIDDDVANYEVTFAVWEDDGGLGNDQLDIYGGSTSGRGVKYTINIATEDDFSASLDGSEDGTADSDDDDAILDIRIQVI